MSTPTTPQNQTPTNNNPTRKLATALAIAAVLALLIIGYILTNKTDPKPASAPTPTPRAPPAPAARVQPSVGRRYRVFCLVCWYMCIRDTCQSHACSGR